MHDDDGRLCRTCLAQHNSRFGGQWHVPTAKSVRVFQRGGNDGRSRGQLSCSKRAHVLELVFAVIRSVFTRKQCSNK